MTVGKSIHTIDAIIKGLRANGWEVDAVADGEYAVDAFLCARCLNGPNVVDAQLRFSADAVCCEHCDTFEGEKIAFGPTMARLGFFAGLTDVCAPVMAQISPYLDVLEEHYATAGEGERELPW